MKLTEYLTPDQAARLMKTLDEWTASRCGEYASGCNVFSGLRRGEIFKLKDRDIDLQIN